jgi:hypothetical protein
MRSAPDGCKTMEHAQDTRETFVLRPGPLRVVLLSVVLVFGAGVFLFLAAVAVVIKVDSLLARAALSLLALVLAALALCFLLLLRTNIIRIEVGPERLKLRTPRVRGPLVLLSSIREDIPYSAIASVEAREEVYSSFGLVTVQRAFSIVTRDGRRLPIGIMAENLGAQMPFDQAAARIATRAGLSVVDRGAVRVGGVLRAIIRDVPPWSSAAMTVPERKVWHRRAALTMQFIGLLVVAVALLRACSGS